MPYCELKTHIAWMPISWIIQSPEMLEEIYQSCTQQCLYIKYLPGCPAQIWRTGLYLLWSSGQMGGKLCYVFILRFQLRKMFLTPSLHSVPEKILKKDPCAQDNKQPINTMFYPQCIDRATLLSHILTHRLYWSCPHRFSINSSKQMSQTFISSLSSSFLSSRRLV